MLGTNDSKVYQWNPYEYEMAYKDMINTFLKISPTPKVYLQIPPPLKLEINKDNKNDKEFDEMVVNNKLPEMIPKIAKELNIPDDQIINQF